MSDLLHEKRMKEEFLSDWNSLWIDIPMWIYETGFLVLLVGLVIWSWTRGTRKGLKYVLVLLLIEYVLLIYCSTVFFRNTGKLQYDFIPFWSYRDYFNGVNRRLLAENIMNMVVFVPVGMLTGVAFRGMTWKKVMVIGMWLSIGIEVLQFVLKRGFSEVDDVMHNTIGCLIGYGLCCIIRFGYERVCKRSVGVL